MNRNIKIYILSVLVAFSCFISCEDEKEKYLDDFDTLLYFNTAGQENVTIYKTGLNSFHPIVINKGGYELKATTNVVCQLISEETLQMYNQENGTSYIALPNDCYKFPESQNVSFGSEELAKVLNVELITDKIHELDPKVEYVLPLELINSEDSINHKLDKKFVRPVVVIPSVHISSDKEMEVSISKSSEEITEVTMEAGFPIENIWDFNCTFEVDETLLEEYNQESETQYKLLPSDAFETTGKFDFPKGEIKSESTLKFFKSKITPGEYILPLRLVECSQQGFVIEKGKDICLIKVSYGLPVITLTADMLSTNAQEPSEGPIANLVDGNLETFFHSAWSVSVDNPPHNFGFALTNEVQNIQFEYYLRHNNGNQGPVEIIIKGSNDGENFETVFTISEGLPSGAGAKYKSAVLSAPSSYKHWRFDIPKSGAGTNTFFSMAEFKLWAE